MNAVRRILMPDVMLTCLQTDKFKTNCMSVNLLTQLNRDNASLHAIMPYVLRRGTTKHPDMESISAQLDEYYGARLEPVVRKKGEIQILGFCADFADDAFIPGGENLLEKIAELLSEVMLSPMTSGGILSAQYVNSEREKLLEQIRARINDKRSYAQERLFELMCFGEDYAVHRLGSEDAAVDIDNAALTKKHRDLLTTAPIEIFYCGSADEARVSDAIAKAFERMPRGEIDTEIGTDVRLNAVDAQPRYYTESMDVTQGKLSIGFRLGECMEEPDHAAIRVMNAVYGGSITSKLFMNVREKLSLAYYASSATDIYKGVMAVSSGIEFDKYESALTEVFSQLDAMRRGEITADELEAASSYIASGMRSISDSLGALEDFYLSQNIQGLANSPEELAAASELVTKSEVVEITKGIECDAVYFLKGPEDMIDDD